ncbi:conserved hypothetical protein [Histoplasma capsulatum var. duboisii H88]|uniref:Uncharacterized protein n=2 Tax=Ajellomyces capsulatus (strain H88) TaxID=544711 RepID=F0UTL2_AJEC8|nr:conserved hypothetical protein [Histoplasma capsulatum var. duboisii H88]
MPITEVDACAGPSPPDSLCCSFEDPFFVPVWERSHVKYAQNLLECDGKPIEYDDEEVDFIDNCFFFPEDCSCPSLRTSSAFSADVTDINPVEMIPELPGIKMLDPEALTSLLEDNLCAPEITSIMIFATNGAIFAHASSLPARKLRNLSATYGAAYLSYAVNAPTGNLTGVNPASHPSSFVTAPSVPLGDVGSIAFEFENLVAVVTKIADKVLLAVMGPNHLSPLQHRQHPPSSSHSDGRERAAPGSAASDTEQGIAVVESYSTAFDSHPMGHPHSMSLASSAPNPTCAPAAADRPLTPSRSGSDAALQLQWEIDRSNDLERLASLNLDASPAVLLALESKSAALGKFLSNKLQDLEYPDDF